MNKREIILQLTDIRFHATKARQTTSFINALDKAEKKGEPARVYSPIPEPGKPDTIQFSSDGKRMKVSIHIPDDMLDLVKRGLINLKVELPDGQLVPISFAPDVEEKVKKVEKQRRTELIHSTKMREQKYKRYNQK